ncbi:MAG: methyltransferase domain-containing protein [Flavobacteriales bacterium]|nr:methyltransferase domain-containing protein [Flavobacteriales bacterium]
MRQEPIICPYCQNPILDTSNKSYACELNHSFDISKEGYINLLPVNQKKSKSPGDNEMMISARRAFLELGFYDPLIEHLKTIIQTDFIFNDNHFIGLDAGCGEGYYSEKVMNNIQGLTSEVLGTDISKYAVKNAAKKYKDNFYFVSSIVNLPIATESIDFILSIFSPIYSEEFQRILVKDGYVIVVSPGENHLKELAQLIYDTFKPHENNVPEKMGSSFELQATKKATFNIHITEVETLLILLKMTPYYWSTSKENLAKMESCKDITITCDFNISIFKHKTSTP